MPGDVPERGSARTAVSNVSFSILASAAWMAAPTNHALVGLRWARESEPHPLRNLDRPRSSPRWTPTVAEWSHGGVEWIFEKAWE